MNRWLLVAFLPLACARAGPAISPAVAVADPAPRGVLVRPSIPLLEFLPSDGSVLVGANRDVTEKDRFDALQWMASRTPNVWLPTCAFEVVAKIERAVATVDSHGSSMPAFVARGDGLRVAVESCLRTMSPGVTIEAEAGITTYRDRGKIFFHAAWVDDATIVWGLDAGSAPTPSSATSSVREQSEAPLASLLPRVNPSSSLWFVIDVPRFMRSWPSAIPRPSQIAGELAQSHLRVTATLPSSAEADELAARLLAFRKQLPGDAAAVTADVTVTVEKNLVVVDFPVRKLIARQLNIDEASVPETAIPVAAVGIVVAVGIPALEASRKDESDQPH